MTDITAELAALPKWPEQPSDSFPVIAMNQLVEELTALRARLAIAERMLDNCSHQGRERSCGDYGPCPQHSLYDHEARAYLAFREKENAT